jgi:prephenate dehydrogenase
MTSIGIISTGRFAAVLDALFAKNQAWVVKHYSHSKPVDNKILFSLKEIASSDVIIPAVPVSAMNSVLKEIAENIPPGNSPLVVSICSVMGFPEKWLLKALPTDTDILVTHPMFGPISTKQGTEFTGLRLVWNPIRIKDVKRLSSLKSFFTDQGLQLIHLTSDQHDLIMAKSQAMSFLFGQIGIKLGLKSTSLDTKGFSMLLENQAIVASDSYQLFLDICRFNPKALKQIRQAKKELIEILEEIKKE